MSLKIRERDDNTYLYLQEKDGKTIFLGKLGEITNYKDRTIKAYGEISKKYPKYLDDTIKLISILPNPEIKKYSSKLIKELERHIDYVSSLSDTKKQTNGDRTKVRPPKQEKVAVTGIHGIGTKSLEKIEEIILTAIATNDGFSVMFIVKKPVLAKLFRGKLRPLLKTDKKLVFLVPTDSGIDMDNLNEIHAQLKNCNTLREAVTYLDKMGIDLSIKNKLVNPKNLKLENLPASWTQSTLKIDHFMKKSAIKRNPLLDRYTKRIENDLQNSITAETEEKKSSKK